MKTFLLLVIAGLLLSIALSVVDIKCTLKGGITLHNYHCYIPD